MAYNNFQSESIRLIMGASTKVILETTSESHQLIALQLSIVYNVLNVIHSLGSPHAHIKVLPGTSPCDFVSQQLNLIHIHYQENYDNYPEFVDSELNFYPASTINRCCIVLSKATKAEDQRACW